MLVHALGDLRARKAVPELVELMPTQAGHHECIHAALRSIGDPAAIPLLKKLLSKTKNAQKKRAIEEVISHLENLAASK